jgi:hypothetical protein
MAEPWAGMDRTSRIGSARAFSSGPAHKGTTLLADDADLTVGVGVSGRQLPSDMIGSVSMVPLVVAVVELMGDVTMLSSIAASRACIKPFARGSWVGQPPTGARTGGAMLTEDDDEPTLLCKRISRFMAAFFSSA